MVAALAAAIQHIRAGRIDRRLLAWMAPPSMVGAGVGGLVSGSVPGNALLLATDRRHADRLRRRPPASSTSRPAAGEARVSIRAALLTGRLVERQLLRALGSVLIVAGAAMIVQALV